MNKNIAPDEFQDVSGDPLARYYRIPGVHVRLPSNGAFMPPGSVEFTSNGDVPVYPMRAADELLLKSGDALMSGYAIEELIKSCVPAIRAPRMISGPDLDVLLLAIRAATYGEWLDIEPVCPKCEAQSKVQVSLPQIMATMTMLAPENTVRLSDDVVVFLRPYNMDNATRVSIASYEEARKVQALEDTDEASEPKRQKQVNESMQRIVHLSMDILAACVLRVVVQEGEVRDPVSIRKFIGNVSKAWVDKLQVKMEEMSGGGIDKHYDVTCAECGHTWRPEIEFNPSTFFASAS